MAGAAAWFTGRPDEGIALTGRAVQLGHTLASPISELLARIFKGLVHHLRGESELARSEAEVLSAEGARLSLQLPLGFGHILGGALRAIETADPSGVADIEAGMNELAASGGQAGAPIAFVLLAEAHLATGATETAREVARAGLAIADALDQHFVDAELLRLRRSLHARRGCPSPTRSPSWALRSTRRKPGDRPSLALRAACDLADLAPEATESVSALLKKIEGGHGTRDHSRAQVILADAGLMTKDPSRAPRRRRHHDDITTTTRVYLAGPMFSAGDKMEQSGVGRRPGGSRLRVPRAPEQRDRGRCRDAAPQRSLLHGSNMLEPLVLDRCIVWVTRTVVALDVYQVVEGCQCTVLNIDGRVPDEGSLVEATLAWYAGHPVVPYKTTSIAELGGNNNPMIGVISRWAPVSLDRPGVVAAVKAAVKSAVAGQPVTTPPLDVQQLIDLGQVISDIRARPPLTKTQRTAAARTLASLPLS